MVNKVTQEFLVENKNGLHARPSASFVKKANEFQSCIRVMNKNGEVVDGKSIIGLLLLEADFGSKIVVTAEGKDAEKAIYALGILFKNKFGEYS